jgi:hypothetical protein
VASSNVNFMKICLLVQTLFYGGHTDDDNMNLFFHVNRKVDKNKFSLLSPTSLFQTCRCNLLVSNISKVNLNPYITKI